MTPASPTRHISAGWGLKLHKSKRWDSATFKGAVVLLDVVPPAGMILADVAIVDGRLEALVVQDDPAAELVREYDASEAERFAIECARDARLGQVEGW